MYVVRIDGPRRTLDILGLLDCITPKVANYFYIIIALCFVIAVTASFAAWGPLLEETPSAAHELYYWEAASESADSTASATNKDH